MILKYSLNTHWFSEHQQKCYLANNEKIIYLHFTYVVFIQLHSTITMICTEHALESSISNRYEYLPQL